MVIIRVHISRLLSSPQVRGVHHFRGISHGPDHGHETCAIAIDAGG